MIYLKLLYNFLIIGACSIGGGYSAVALVKDVANNFANLSDEMIANFIAIAESTPGPVAVNLATFIGAEVADIPGAAIATFGVVFPAFAIILIFAVFFIKFLKYSKVKRVLAFIRPCVIGIIMAVGLFMFRENIDTTSMKTTMKTMIVTLIILFILPFYKTITKKKISAIPLIVLGAILGIAINYIM